jgi:hypothetical protein
MPTAANRMRAFLLAFNEISWIDILNGYDFKYARQAISQSNLDIGQRAIQRSGASPRMGVAPLECVPPVKPAAAQATYNVR